VLDRLAERRFAAERGEVAVSASVGIALLLPGIPMSDEELLAAAEDALASARAAGGDRIAFDRDHSLPRIDQPRSDPPVGEAADRGKEA
jgi:PleD family two-component response regulator